MISELQTRFDVLGDLINSKFRKDVIDHETWKDLHRVFVETRSLHGSMGK